MVAVLSSGHIRELAVVPRTRLVGRLQSLIAVSLVALLVLCTAAIHYGVRMHEASKLVVSDAVSLDHTVRLEVLLERHRRLVEAIAKDGSRTSKLMQVLEDVSMSIQRRLASGSVGLSQDIHGFIDDLIGHGRDVVQLVNEGAPATQLAELDRAHKELASTVHRLLDEHRNNRSGQMANTLGSVSRDSQSLIQWVAAAGTVAFCLLGPVGFLAVRRVARRFDSIARAMVHLAGNDTKVEVSGQDDPDEVGDMARAVVVFKKNAIELLQSRSKLEQLNEQLDAAIGNMPLGLTMFDAEDRLLLCNDRYRSMYGFTREQTQPGAPRLLMLEHLISSGHVKLDEADKIRRLGPAFSTEGITNLHFSDGRIIEVTRRQVRDGGWVSVHEDITERRHQEARIAHMVGHDGLTGLDNRRLFREKLEERLVRLQPGESVAVHCFDIDGFKAINDTHGHVVGDCLLKAVGERLLECGDSADFAARMGGDEFAVVQTVISDTDESEQLARHIGDCMSKPFAINGLEIVVSTSMGVATGPDHGDSADQLLRNANMALYCAKTTGRGALAFFEPEMDARVQQRRALERDLRKAVRKGELELHYQPILSLESGAIFGFEALMRWRNPERGLVPPSQFIAIAEELGLIVPMGEWAIEMACQEAAQWPAPYRVAVNLSPIQFKSERLLTAVENALRKSGLDPARLELEITESTLLQDSPATLATLHNLHRLGVSISMDDFGTGYSSLSYLRSFPFDKIKIDKAFIRDIGEDAEAGAIVEAVVSLARSLNMETLAEGVETVVQREALKRAGCQQAQGFLFSHPVPSADIAATVARLTTPEQRVA